MAWPCSCGLAVLPRGFRLSPSARGGDAASTSRTPGTHTKKVCPVTPRGALRAQAVLSARTRTRFLPRDLARADEETAEAPETQRGFHFNRGKRHARKWCYACATAWWGDAVPASRSDGVMERGEVLKFRNSKVLKFGLWSIPCHFERGQATPLVATVERIKG